MSINQERMKRHLLQPGFIAAVVLLAVAAVGLNGATQYLKLHFKKLPVEIAKPLKAVPSDFGPYVQVSKDEPLEADIESALATKEYIFRDYVDTRVAPDWKQRIETYERAALESKKGGSASDAHKWAIQKLQSERPLSVVNLAVTYYTGMVDTVAHIPDRCYIADGYVPSNYTTENWQTGNRQTQVRFINFEDQTSDRKVPRSVAYFFKVNDVYQSDPLEVRFRLQDLRERYGFYSKVELMMTTRDRAQSAKAMADFLALALPEIEKCFPDWNQVKSRDLKK